MIPQDYRDFNGLLLQAIPQGANERLAWSRTYMDIRTLPEIAPEDKRPRINEELLS